MGNKTSQVTPDFRKSQHAWNNQSSLIWRGWNNWIDLADARPKSESGAYVLGIRGANGQFAISRLLGRDEHGILDIGESVDLKARIGTLRRCVSADDVTGHMAGWRYRYLQLHTTIKGGLVVSWKAGPDSGRLEAETMASYLGAFGELPPLNYKANWTLLRNKLAKHSVVVTG